MKELVSVIIPSYNHEKYIKKCIESVLNQTYKNIEVLVEDDCSTDNTREIIKSIKDKRLKKIFSKKNKGTVRTINHLMSLCKGDYIAIIGSDDYWYPEKLEKQVKIFKEQDVGAVFSEVDVIDENDNIYENDINFTSDIFRKDNLSQGKRMRLFYEVGNHLCHSSSIISRKVFEDIGYYNPIYRQLHDFDYWVRIANKYSIYIVNEKLMAYRRNKTNNQSVSSNNNENSIRVINELNVIIEKMMNEINDKHFVEGFKDLFVKKESSSSIDLDTEKFLILSKLKKVDIAMNYLLNHKDCEKIISNLENKYSYSLKKLYTLTGKASEIYPIELTNPEFEKNKRIIKELEEENKILSGEIERLLNSKSWKITKPLRFVMEIAYGKRKKNKI